MTSTGSQAYVYVAVEGADLKKKKIGRPRKDKKNSQKVSVYLSEDLYQALRHNCEASGDDISMYIRKLIRSDCTETMRKQNIERDMEWQARMSDALEFLTVGGEK